MHRRTNARERSSTLIRSRPNYRPCVGTQIQSLRCRCVSEAGAHKQPETADCKRLHNTIGDLSQKQLAAKYGLRSSRQLHNWIKWHNNGRTRGHKMSGESRVKQRRETTQEERVAIVRYCLESESNFGATAMKYNISYRQVYTWVKKFKALGGQT